MTHGFATLVGLAGFAAVLASAGEGEATRGRESALPRVLVYTASAGFEHDVVRRPAEGELSLVERELVRLGVQSAFEAVPSRDPAEFDRERLARYDAVLFYTTGELPLSAEQRASFLDFVASGKGFVGVHCATDTFYEWPEYGALVGAYFDGHPWHEKVRVRVEDAQHPATRYWGDSCEITDEIYQFRAPYDRSKLHVLASLDAGSVDLARPTVKRTDRDFALAWTREFGSGRVFYTALGHRPEVWMDPRFRAHLRGGIEWALRHDAPPVKLSVEDEPYRAFANEHAGDPARGFEVFRRESGSMCARCHAVFGEGGTVGPDLSTLARDHTRAEIVEHVLAPSARIAADYRALILELKDGTLRTGRIESESPERIVLWDTDAKLFEIATQDVAARRASDASLMPEGLARTLTPAEFADLVAWLGTLKGS